MSKLINFRFARFVKILLDFSFAIMVFLCAAFAAWIISTPFIVHRTDILGRASVSIPVALNIESKPDITISGNIKEYIHSSILDFGTVHLRIVTDDALLIIISNLSKLFVTIGLAYIFYLLRETLQNILDGHPFAPNNAQHIRRVGYTVFLVGFLRPVVAYIANTEMLNRLQITTPKIGISYSPNFGVLLVSILILLLAYIWSYGFELEQDSVLTV